jgi:cold shock CspA family protein
MTTSRTSGALVYWNAHTGFGEIDFDDGHGRVGIYRADLLKAGIRKPRVGDRFHFDTGVAANGMTAAIDLCPDVIEPALV